MYFFCMVHEQSCVWLERFDTPSEIDIQDKFRCEMVTEWAYEGQSTDEMERTIRRYGF